LKNWLKGIMGVLIIGTLFLTGCQNDSKVIAVVNGEDIFKKELDAKITQLGETNGQIVDESTKEQLYERLISQKILNQDYAKHNIVVTEEEANAEIDKEAISFGSREAYLNLLAEKGYPEKEVIKAYIDQISYMKWYKTVVVDSVPIDENAVKAAFDAEPAKYKQVEPSHILISSTDASTDDAAKAKAESIIAHLNAGEDFVALSDEFNEDASVKSMGGNLGEFVSKAKSPFVEPFTDATVVLNKGEYTKVPVKTDYGYHIIKANDVKDSYADLRNSVEDDIYSAQRDEQYMAYMNSLIESAQIERKMTFATGE